MSLHGEFRTYPFPDLLQWLEMSHRTGRVMIRSGGGERVFVLGKNGLERYGASGLYERLARLLRLLGALDETAGSRAVEAARACVRAEEAFASAGVPGALVRELAHDDALQSASDLFDDASAHFDFGEDLDADGETIRVDATLCELLFEGARRHDEAGPALEHIPTDTMIVLPGQALGQAPRALAAAAVAAIGGGATVGAVRLALGLSRAGAARILYELWRDGHVRIDGAKAPGPDPLTRVLEQGKALLFAGQYDAAALVFNSLLAADRSDRRVRDFARAVEREHVEALYRKLSPLAVPRLLAAESQLAALRQDERTVAALFNERWDVSTLVLASPLRELQTLRAIERMVELGFVAIESPQG